MWIHVSNALFAGERNRERPRSKASRWLSIHPMESDVKRVRSHLSLLLGRSSKGEGHEALCSSSRRCHG